MNLKKLFSGIRQATVEFGSAKARALTDIPGTGIKSGEFFTASINKINQLVADGLADAKATEQAVYGADIPPAKTIKED